MQAASEKRGEMTAEEIEVSSQEYHAKHGHIFMCSRTDCPIGKEIKANSGFFKGSHGTAWLNKTAWKIIAPATFREYKKHIAEVMPNYPQGALVDDYRFYRIVALD